MNRQTLTVSSPSDFLTHFPCRIPTGTSAVPSGRGFGTPASPQFGTRPKRSTCEEEGGGLKGGNKTHVRLEAGRVLQDLRLQVPGLGRARPVVHGVGEAVVRVEAPLLRAELREVAAAELNLGGRGERGARSRLVPWAGGQFLSAPSWNWTKTFSNMLIEHCANDCRKLLNIAF